jgi:ubiquinone/menaquinone biosynthesis C-methylase UbiE
MDRSIKNIDKSRIAELYNNRFVEFGRNIKTVGWGSEKDQYLRFEMLFRGINPKGKKILDIGCGLGDLIPFLNEKTGGDYTYIGIDIAEKLIIDARKIYASNNRLFYIGDIFSITETDIDIAVLSGALSFKTQGIETYAKNTLLRMVSLSKEVACLNFLSKYVDFELEKNQHYSPEKIFSWAKSASNRVNLFHDYPLYEFSIQIFKN